MALRLPEGSGHMIHPLDLEGEARTNRDIAARARQMARLVSLMEDRVRIERFASELEHRASVLEADAASLRSDPSAKRVGPP
jgi:hypothetical protein